MSSTEILPLVKLESISIKNKIDIDSSSKNKLADKTHPLVMPKILPGETLNGIRVVKDLFYIEKAPTT